MLKNSGANSSSRREAVTNYELDKTVRVTRNATGVVRRLKLDGLVKKVTSKNDRRIQSVTISAEGQKLWDAMHADYDRIISELLSGQTDDQIRALTKALDDARIDYQAVEQVYAGYVYGDSCSGQAAAACRAA